MFTKVVQKRKDCRLQGPPDVGSVSGAGSSSSEPEVLSSTTTGTVGLRGSVLGVGVTLLSSESAGAP